MQRTFVVFLLLQIKKKQKMRPKRLVLLLLFSCVLVTYFVRWTRDRFQKDRFAVQLSFQVRELVEENQLLRSQNQDLRLRLLEETAKLHRLQRNGQRNGSFEVSFLHLLSSLISIKFLCFLAC